VPFPAALHGVSVRNRWRAISASCSRPTSIRTRVAAIIIEPVQGEGGFYQAPPELMRALRKICDENGIL
jgi:4-aminobutyrate aminotransferase